MAITWQALHEAQVVTGNNVSAGDPTDTWTSYWDYGGASTAQLSVGESVTFTNVSRWDISLGLNSTTAPTPNRYNPNFSILTQNIASGGGYENAVFYSAGGLGTEPMADVVNDTYEI